MSAYRRIAEATPFRVLARTDEITFASRSILREHAAKNLLEGRLWYEGFAELPESVHKYEKPAIRRLVSQILEANRAS